MMRKAVFLCACGGVTLVAAVFVGGLVSGHSVRETAGVMKAAVESRVSRKTVGDRIREIEAKRPALIAAARRERGAFNIIRRN